MAACGRGQRLDAIRERPADKHMRHHSPQASSLHVHVFYFEYMRLWTQVNGYKTMMQSIQQ